MKTNGLSKKLRKTGMVAMVTGAALTALGTMGCDQPTQDAVAALSPDPSRRPVGQLPSFDNADVLSAKMTWQHNETFLA